MPISFSKLNLPFSIVDKLTGLGIDQTYPIQEKAIPEILKENDILGIAQTGSGKTLAYLLPIINRLQYFHENPDRHPNILILLPSRELGQQVYEMLGQLIDVNRYANKTILATGGSSINIQMKHLSGVRILIATPGRLLELAQKNAVNLKKLQMLILDEADKLMNKSFEKELNQLLRSIPTNTQKVLFSATLSPEIDSLQKLLLNKPTLIEIENAKEVKTNITQYAFQVTPEEKGPILRNILRKWGAKSCLIFASSVKEVDKITNKLNKNGFKAESIHSKKSQNQRTSVLKDLKNSKINILVSTDLLARGIDISDLPLVINYELPRSPKDFIHRIGRTARAEKTGQVISLITEEEAHHYSVIQKKMKTEVVYSNLEEYLNS